MGPLHPYITASLNNLAQLYRAQGRYEQAELSLARALSICEQQLGSLHPSTIIVRSNYALLLREAGREAEIIEKKKQMMGTLKRSERKLCRTYLLCGYEAPSLTQGQVARRVREEQFCRYHMDQQADAVEFTSVLKVLLEQVPLQVDIPEMLTHWKWFDEWSIGCIGILSDWGVETASTLCHAGETVLTLEALTKHSLKPAQRLLANSRLKKRRKKANGSFSVSWASLQLYRSARCLIPHHLPARQ